MNGIRASPLSEGQAADLADLIPRARGPYRPDSLKLTCIFYLVMIILLRLTSAPCLVYNYWLHVTSHSSQMAHYHDTSGNAVSQGRLHALKGSTHRASLQRLGRVLEVMLDHEVLHANYQRIVRRIHAIYEATSGGQTP